MRVADVAIVDIRGRGFRARFDVAAFSTFPSGCATHELQKELA